MSTMNPNNPVARASLGQWHKIAAIILYKFGVRHVEITQADVDAIAAAGLNIGIADDKGYIEVFLLTPDESRDAVARYGGTPNQS